MITVDLMPHQKIKHTFNPKEEHDMSISNGLNKQYTYDVIILWRKSHSPFEFSMRKARFRASQSIVGYIGSFIIKDISRDHG